MALVKGTNCGFVTIAPIADPADGALYGMEGRSVAGKFVAPAGANKVIEIGWWCDNASAESNFEVGIYDHNVGDNNPESVVGTLYQTNAKGTEAGWKTVTVDISITGGTTYWLAVQQDDAGSSRSNWDPQVGEKTNRKHSQSTLLDPWGASSDSYEYILAIYAVYEEGEAPEGTGMQLQIGGAWKLVPLMKLQIGGAWKAVEGAQLVIDDGGKTWKTIF